MSAPGDQSRDTPAPGRRWRSEQERIDRARMRSVAAVAAGLVAGALLAVARTHLGGAFGPLADSAAAWLLVPCVLGALMRTRRGALAAGCGCALVELGGWTATTALRGLAMPPRLIWLWVACSLVGGPLAGLAGDLIRRPRPGREGLGAAMAAGLLLAEGVWTDFHELHADGPGWLWAAVAVLLAAGLLRGARQIRWLALTLPLAFAGELALAQIHR